MIQITTTCLALCILGAVSIETADADVSVDVHLIVRQTATPVGETVIGTLPSSISAVPVGTSYVVEIWMQDTWDASMPGGPSPGLTGGEFDLHYDTDLSDATTLHYEGPFDWCFGHQYHTGEILEESGLVNDFSTATGSSMVGVKPNYARLGYVAFEASNTGTQNYALDGAKIARRGLGYVDPSQINLGSAAVAHVPEPSAFTMLWLGTIGLLAHLRRRYRHR
ncbi:MAG TPA: hypothetical protein VJL29_13895 [Thermoguttaceae bacterium]|nr:hypothetical protein [Thermoguttaceae bacterium]